jgi:hypothetical protein
VEYKRGEAMPEGLYEQGLWRELSTTPSSAAISPARGRVEMASVLADLIKEDEDRIMVIDLGPVDGGAEERIIFLGVHAHRAENNYRMIARCIQVGPGGPWGYKWPVLRKLPRRHTHLKKTLKELTKRSQWKSIAIRAFEILKLS